MKAAGAPEGFSGMNQTYTSLVEVVSILRGSPKASCNRVTDCPTLSAAMRDTGRTA